MRDYFEEVKIIYGLLSLKLQKNVKLILILLSLSGY